MERVRVLRAEVRHFCSPAVWASCPSGTVRTARCSLHWCRRGSADLPFASGDSRKRWPGPGWGESPINPQWSAERRAALVMRVAAVPGNGCSFPSRAWQRARCASRRSASLVFWGKQNGNASVEAKPSLTRDTPPMQSHRGNDEARHCERSEAIQRLCKRPLDCSSQALLAMTRENSALTAPMHEGESTS
jgi:hypothetical protein